MNEIWKKRFVSWMTSRELHLRNKEWKLKKGAFHSTKIPFEFRKFHVPGGTVHSGCTDLTQATARGFYLHWLNVPVFVDSSPRSAVRRPCFILTVNRTIGFDWARSSNTIDRKILSESSIKFDFRNQSNPIALCKPTLKLDNDFEESF